MVFITAGMGGGTGTGASPVIAKLAKENGNADRRHRHFAAGRRRQDPLRTGVPGIEELRQNVDSLLIINNENILEIYGRLA